MQSWETYGSYLPGVERVQGTGSLLVIEGTDGVGRSTQVARLKTWLEKQGRAVLDTGMTRSDLAGKGIKQAKIGHTLGPVTASLFYATDFAARLENEMVPALRAGFVVLTDRYIYSLMARASVRGVSPQWLEKVYAFALRPDAIFYLQVGLEELIPRVVFGRGFDFWESGMDLHLGNDMYDSFCRYQNMLRAEFDAMAERYQFEVVDASRNADDVFQDLQGRIAALLGISLAPAYELD